MICECEDEIANDTLHPQTGKITKVATAQISAPQAVYRQNGDHTSQKGSQARHLAFGAHSRWTRREDGGIGNQRQMRGWRRKRKNSDFPKKWRCIFGTRTTTRRCRSRSPITRVTPKLKSFDSRRGQGSNLQADLTHIEWMGRSDGPLSTEAGSWA